MQNGADVTTVAVNTPSSVPESSGRFYPIHSDMLLKRAPEHLIPVGVWVWNVAPKVNTAWR